LLTASRQHGGIREALLLSRHGSLPIPFLIRSDLAADPSHPVATYPGDRNTRARPGNKSFSYALGKKSGMMAAGRTGN
jgi:hypothetical protein